jgi:hypothetical protein
MSGRIVHRDLTPEELRESVLHEADRIVPGDRSKNYGHPEDDFAKVTGMALALWGRGPETPLEHALYMILVKLSRLSHTPRHRDSLVDIAGYVKTYEMILGREDDGFA